MWVRKTIESKDSSSYEVSLCESWTHTVFLNVEIPGMAPVSIEVTPNQMISSRNFTLSMVSSVDSFPYQINECLIRNGATYGMAPCNKDNELAIGRIGEVQCPTETSAKKVDRLCKALPQLILDSIQERTVSCSTTMISPSAVLLKTKLPATINRVSFFSDSRGVYADLSESTDVQVQMSLKNLKVSRLVDQSSCSITFKNLKGCYNCPSGAVLTLTGETDFGSAIVAISCGDWHSQLSVTSETGDVALTFPSNTSNVNVNCHFKCPKNSGVLTITGKLDFIWGNGEFDTKSTHTATNDISIWDVPSYVNLLYRTILVVLVFSFLFVVLRLIMRLRRKKQK